MNSPRHIEEASLNAWPALNSLLYDGWLLRFAEGYTKRANSVTPLYCGDFSIEDKIAFCEEQYRQKGLPPLFRLAAATEIAELDRQLAARDYRQIDVTSVQSRTLAARLFTESARAEVLTGRDGLAAWLNAFHALNPHPGARRKHQAILERIISPVCPLVLTAGGEIVSCGLGVLQGELLGLFDIVTRESERRRGYGREVTESLLAWGRRHGARCAYLQVMQSNPAAQALYQQLGFVARYQYWYRLAPEQV